MIHSPNLNVDLNVGAWGTKSRVKTLGANIAPIIFGLGGATQRMQVGWAPGSYFQRPYTFNDANNDGIIATSEVTLGPTATFQGQPFPDHGGSVSSTITVFQRFHLYGLVDGRFGNKLFNSTEQFRCGLSNCRGRNDRTAPLAEQAAAVANIRGTQAGYMEDADFVKFRELSLTYDAPPNWATRIGASSLSFTTSADRPNRSKCARYASWSPKTAGRTFGSRTIVLRPASRSSNAAYAAAGGSTANASVPTWIAHTRSGSAGSASGRFGFRISWNPASSGVRSPFLRLHGMQQVTMLSHPLWPPRATGITWSKVSCPGGRRWPQYWQRWSSRV